MSIRNKDYFMQALWDWGILNGCFGESRISPTDIDGLVERKGKFLLIEAKSPGKDIPFGQQIMFNNLIKTGIFRILVVWGKPDCPEELQRWGQPKQSATLETFRQEVEDWYKKANAS